MNILQIIGSADPVTGGPIEFVLRMGQALAAHGHTQEIVSLDAPGAAWATTFPARLHPVGTDRAAGGLHRGPLSRYRYTPHLAPWLRSNVGRFDLAIVNGLWNYSARAARAVLPRHDTPYVVFPHGMLDPWFRREAPVKTALKQLSWWHSEGPLLANAAAVLFTAEEERSRAQGAFWPYRCREKVVRFGTLSPPEASKAQSDAFLAEAPDLQGHPFLLFLGRLHPKKGCDLLIEAFALCKEREDIHLVIAGPDQLGWGEALRARARALGLDDRIHWLDGLWGDAKWGALRRCEALILPSHQENFGLVVAEAMACGRPVLITDKVNIWRDVVSCNGGLVESDTADGITLLVERFTALSRQARNDMGRDAAIGFSTFFDLETQVLDILDVGARRLP